MADCWDDDGTFGGSDDDVPVAGNDDNPTEDLWADEDVDDEPLMGDDWDEDPDKKVAKKPVAMKPKALSKAKMKAKQEAARKRAKELAEEEANDPELQYKRKMEAQKVVEEADNKLAEELFAGLSTEEKQTGLLVKESKGIEDYLLEVESDYIKLAKEITKKTKRGKSKHLRAFLSELVKEMGKTMTHEDVTQVKKDVMVVFNKKVKERQNKKKASKRPALKTSSHSNPMDDYSMGGGAAYDDYDDFM
jgi:hypothetical protein